MTCIFGLSLLYTHSISIQLRGRVVIHWSICRERNKLNREKGRTNLFWCRLILLRNIRPNIIAGIYATTKLAFVHLTLLLLMVAARPCRKWAVAKHVVLPGCPLHTTEPELVSYVSAELVRGVRTTH
jgi:hypothetical protein